MPRPNREPEIRAAALRCFAELGYDATRVKHIAAEAGVSEAALYAHWRGKEELAADLYAEGLRVYAGAIAELAAVAGRSVRERLSAVADASLQLYRQQPDAWRFLVQGQGRFLAALDADFPYPLHVVESLIAEGQRDGSVRDGDVKVLAGIFTGCFTYPVIVAIYARAGTADPSDPEPATLISDAAWAAIARQTAG